MRAAESRLKEMVGNDPPHFRLRIAAEPFAVREALRSVAARFAGQIGPLDFGSLELVLAEVLNNVVEHGYDSRPGGRIDLVIRQTQGALFCCITDDGSEMPRRRIPPDKCPASRAVRLSALTEGGWGWHIIHSLVRDLAYLRDGAENRLTFRFDLASGTGSIPAGSGV